MQESQHVQPIEYASIKHHMDNATVFRKFYRHKGPDTSDRRKAHELHCFQRWFILQSYMKQKSIKKIFYADGDSTIFANATEVASMRGSCDAVVNIEAQSHSLHWVGAGEASLWNIHALDDFCDYMIAVYKDYRKLVLSSSSDERGLSDMSLIWLWWTQHKKGTASAWDKGRPYKVNNIDINDPFTSTIRKRFDEAFAFAADLRLPSISNPALVLCNGLDVVNRTVFDHMRGWESGRGFSFNFEQSAQHNGRIVMPSTIASVTARGGRPETMEPTEDARLETTPLQFINIHYTSGGKTYIPYDVCRALSVLQEQLIDSGKEPSGSRYLHQACMQLLRKRGSHRSPYPCLNHGILHSVANRTRTSKICI